MCCCLIQNSDVNILLIPLSRKQHHPFMIGSGSKEKMNRFLVAECRQSWNGFVSKAIALLPTIEWNFLHRNSTDIERYHKGYMMRYVAVLYTLGTACRTVHRVGGIVKLSDCRLGVTDGTNTTKQTHPIIMEGETRRYVKVVKTHCL